ncbi:nicotinate-nucleotide pyrophosphorylase [carboxylating], chloroplastic-like isoform X2 [Phoenix dactylifera]|uniref:Nicotinate-nucleotide pyrophosphorylase [carboxylating], chloroplastic-like isoform X2 n=1 Tax=Phoenix dactylifera TaxID=42345 RepID=A0A8B8ZZJ1_PHODC|nr:nicotinate-nucleotide pyrophosphorylase [carboxylating], chloroplastic-like isoform X2 [Phoenix dactylifera]
MKAEAHFIAKEDGVIAGISFAEMIFNEVDPSLKVEWSQKDGNYVHKGMQFGKVYGLSSCILLGHLFLLGKKTAQLRLYWGLIGEVPLGRVP